MTKPPESTTQYSVPLVVSLFPLPEHVLLPDLPTPYRVFEPRYRQLITDLLELPEDERWIAIPKLAGHLEEGAGSEPTFEPIATVGRLTSITSQPDGNFDIVVRGVSPAWLTEVAIDKPYRVAEVTPLPDVADAEEEVVARRYLTVLQIVSSITAYVEQAAKEIYEVIDSAPDRTTSVYRLASIFLHDIEWRQKFLESRSLERRLEILEDALSIVLALSLKIAGSKELPS